MPHSERVAVIGSTGELARLVGGVIEPGAVVVVESTVFPEVMLAERRLNDGRGAWCSATIPSRTQPR